MRLGSLSRYLGLVAAVAVAPSLADAGADLTIASVAGEAVAVDGDTLIVDGYRVRIHALHAPEMGEPGGTSSKDMAALVV